MTLHASTTHRSIAGLARVAALLCALCAPSLFVLTYGARARAGEWLQDAGEVMWRYSSRSSADGENPRTLFVNGAALRLSTGHTHDAPSAVLDAFQKRCAQRAAQVPIDARTRRELAAARLEWLPGLEGVLRFGGPRSGQLACLDTGVGRPDANELVRRLLRFSTSFDVHDLGDLRFAWARRTDEGTRYLTISTDGPLPLRRMFPSAGDAPGVDPLWLPRPTNSLRVLSAWQDGEVPLLVSYASKGTAAALQARYAQELEAKGFRVRSPAAHEGSEAALLITRGSNLSAALITAPRDGGARATLFDLR